MNAALDHVLDSCHRTVAEGDLEHDKIYGVGVVVNWKNEPDGSPERVAQAARHCLEPRLPVEMALVETRASLEEGVDPDICTILITTRAAAIAPKDR